MNLTSPVLKGTAPIAEVPGGSATSLFKLADDSPDGALGMLMSGLSGVAAALAVAIVLTVYFRTGYRSSRDVLRHGLAATVVLGLLGFVAWDMRHAAQAFLGINPAQPAVEFEIRLPEGRGGGGAPKPRSNWSPTGTRSWPGCRPRWPPTPTAAP